MRKLSITVFISIFILAQSTSFAQKHFTNLDKVAHAIESKLQLTMPGWERTSIKPASIDENTNSDQVIIQQWSSKKRNVKIAVLAHQTEAEAIIALRQFAVDKRTNSKLEGLGDEAYLWGINNSIAFRQGNLTLYMSAVAVVDLDSSEASRNLAEARRKAAKAEHDEEAKLTKNFAHNVAAVLASLWSSCDGDAISL